MNQVPTAASPSGSQTNHHETFVQRASRRIGWAIRDRWPGRKVVRTVQGVEMVLPWSHRLPDYTRDGSIYGQNLVRLAERLAHPGEPLTVLDIGANVGDSALQILHATDARILCVEGDEFYLDFLDINVGKDPRVTVVPALLAAEEVAEAERMKPVRVGGTTRFTAGTDEDVTKSVTVGELRRGHPGFDRLRLAKSDTDGYDVQLIAAIAQTWADCAPVLFFEYDLRLSRLAGLDPLAVWDRLAALGYEEVAIWDNDGHPLGRVPVGSMTEVSAAIDVPLRRRPLFAKTPGPVPYWDVALAHRDDKEGLEAIRDLVPSSSLDHVRHQ